MPRGGARLGAGRRPDPNSKRQKIAAARAEKAESGGKERRGGFTAPDGTKTPDAPPNWPFGTVPPADPVEVGKQTPLEYLLSVMRDPEASASARLTAAVQAAPYMHAKVAPAAKKEAAAAKATKASAGKFGAAAPPKLAAANGKRV